MIFLLEKHNEGKHQDATYIKYYFKFKRKVHKFCISQYPVKKEPY